MKYIISFLTVLFVSAAHSQLVSDPYEIQWNRYFLEYDSVTIAENDVKKVTSKLYSVKRGKLKRERLDFELEFNDYSLPIRLVKYNEFGLRNDWRFNPIWRIFNDYPVYDIYEYDLSYGENNLLSEIIETESMTNSEFVFHKKRTFHYDSLDRLILQRQCDLALPEQFEIDSIIEFSIDSTFITYLSDSTGHIIYSPNYGRPDTCFWTKEVYDLGKIFDRLRARKLLSTDSTAKVIYDQKGLLIKKNFLINVPKDELLRNNYRSGGIRREYEFFGVEPQIDSSPTSP